MAEGGIRPLRPTVVERTIPRRARAGDSMRSQAIKPSDRMSVAWAHVGPRGRKILSGIAGTIVTAPHKR